MRPLFALLIIAIAGCGTSPTKPTASPATPSASDNAKLVDVTPPAVDERDDWDIQIEEIRSRYNQQINALIDQRDPLHEEIVTLEDAKGTAPAEKYVRMGGIIQSINDLIERRDSEVMVINKNKRAHLIERQPVSEEFLKTQRAEATRLKQHNAAEALKNEAAALQYRNKQALQSEIYVTRNALQRAQSALPPVPGPRDNAKTMAKKEAERLAEIEVLKAKVEELERKLKDAQGVQ